MSNQPDNELIRELYARFGLAYYQSECLHRELCFIFAVSGLPPPDLITRPRVDERLAQAYALTLGDVATELKGVLPAELACEVRKAVEARNFLAHRFWFERAHLMFSVGNVHQLIAELDGYAEQFQRLDAIVSEWKKPKLRELGLTDKLIEVSRRRILAGKPDEPLPNRHTVGELKRKLRKRHRLVRVWHVTTERDLKSLIFELADGTLWQLSDIGLAWTRFHKVDPDWIEHPAVKLHLPADILPRPKACGAWDYDFTLANGAVLWVKPGNKKQTFRWGVQTSNTNPGQGSPANRRPRSGRSRAGDE
jgi:hypothetical protein